MSMSENVSKYSTDSNMTSLQHHFCQISLITDSLTAENEGKHVASAFGPFLENLLQIIILTGPVCRQ